MAATAIQHLSSVRGRSLVVAFGCRGIGDSHRNLDDAPCYEQGLGEGKASEFCRVAKVQLRNDAARLTAGGTPAEWKAFLAKTRAQNEALVAAAPPEIKDAVVTVRGVTLKLEALMEKAGYDISTVDRAQLETINSAETAAGGKKLQDYAGLREHNLRDVRACAMTPGLARDSPGTRPGLMRGVHGCPPT